MHHGRGDHLLRLRPRPTTSSGITDGDGHTTAYTHNGAGQLTAMIVNGHTTSYTYDVDGNLTGITDPDGRTTKYTVNAQDLRTVINYSQAGQTTINITEPTTPPASGPR